MNNLKCELRIKNSAQVIDFIEDFNSIIETPMEQAQGILKMLRIEGYFLENLQDYYFRFYIDADAIAEGKTDFNKVWSLEKINDFIEAGILKKEIIDTEAFIYLNAHDFIKFNNECLSLKIDLEFIFKDGSRLIYLMPSKKRRENFIKIIGVKE